jgi:hypothetical protein
MNKFIKYLILFCLIITFKVYAVTGWKYQTIPSKLGEGSLKIATIGSSNIFELAFPYIGKQHAYLSIRKSADKSDVILYIEKGQFQCNDYDTCWVKISFDNSKPFNFEVIGSADGSSNIVFFHDQENLINQIINSKHIAVGIIIYKNGLQVFEFNTVKLHWK